MLKILPRPLIVNTLVWQASPAPPTSWTIKGGGLSPLGHMLATPLSRKWKLGNYMHVLQCIHANVKIHEFYYR